mgnify:CR=1
RSDHTDEKCFDADPTSLKPIGRVICKRFGNHKDTPSSDENQKSFDVTSIEYEKRILIFILIITMWPKIETEHSTTTLEGFYDALDRIVPVFERWCLSF